MIGEDVYLLQVPFGAYWTGVVLIKSAEPILIDSGPSATMVDEVIRPALSEIGCRPKRFVIWPVPIPMVIMWEAMRGCSLALPPVRLLPPGSRRRSWWIRLPMPNISVPFSGRQPAGAEGTARRPSRPAAGRWRTAGRETSADPCPWPRYG